MVGMRASCVRYSWQSVSIQIVARWYYRYDIKFSLFVLIHLISCFLLMRNFKKIAKCGQTLQCSVFKRIYLIYRYVDVNELCLYIVRVLFGNRTGLVRYTFMPEIVYDRSAVREIGRLLQQAIAIYSAVSLYSIFMH